MEESAEAERGRSFLSKLFRTDCYNVALRQLNIERCKDLGSEQRTRLVRPDIHYRSPLARSWFALVQSSDGGAWNLSCYTAVSRRAFTLWRLIPAYI